MAKGSAARLPSPRSPPRKLGVIRAEYRGGNWPNTRNPAGDADGVWVGSVGGMLPNDCGLTVFQHACQLGCEGIVSKRLGSRYRSGRSPDWLKFKNPQAPAVRREAEEDWGRWPKARTAS